jgi:hypothetical protein
MNEKKFYTVEEAAVLLGLTPAEVTLKRERNVLRGFRDGANWVFKTADVEAMARERRSGKASDSRDDDSRDVLLSDMELGGSELGASGTVLGPTSGKAASDSDIKLADSEIGFGDLGRPRPAAKPAPAGEDSGSSADIDLALDDALIDESQVAMDDDASGTVANTMVPPRAKKAEPAPPIVSGGSSVKLAAGEAKLDDDDIVLGTGSGTGSDVSIGGDSGISLVDPTDSGLSLEEPLELGRIDDDSLELGEDDMLTFSEDTGESSAPALKKDEEFLLTPLDEPLEEESDSGSQVIALDSAGPVSDQTATMLAPSIPSDMGSMFEEPMLSGPAPLVAAGAVGAAAFAAPLGAGPLGAASMFGEPGMTPAGASIAVPAEAPYSGMQIAGLTACFVMLIPCGWIVYDLVRAIWHWENATGVSSGLLKLLVG